MINKIFNSTNPPSDGEKNEVADFLFTHLEEYGDPKEDILKAINFSLKKSATSLGGFVLIAKDNSDIIGAVVVNRTGMEGYIPENILVYIATHKNYRGKGVGKQLMNKSIEIAQGDIALHVEPDNPAKFLYEKVGFTSKYVEMRYKQKQDANH
jgi:[ribosomal protein S18]-alanine N-acetyltransferase